MIPVCHLLPPSLFLPTVLQCRKCFTHQRGTRQARHQEAEPPPAQRMLITCVLSQPGPDHPLWIKGEIVSDSLIFHRPEKFTYSLSCGSCATEIIWTHSGQWNPSFSGRWTTSPWLSWGHLCPNCIQLWCMFVGVWCWSVLSIAS